MRTLLALTVLSLGGAGLVGSSAHAQTLPQCFGGDALASAPLTLGDRVTLDSQCQYSREPDTGFRALRDRGSITALLSGLGWSEGEATTVYGRRAAEGEDPPQVSSVFLHHCTDYLLQPGGAFGVTPGATPGSLVVQRRSRDCGAGAIALRFQCRSPRTPATIELVAGQDRAELPVCNAGWDVEASAAGQPAYSLGRVAPGGETPLQAAMRDEGAALLRPSWDGERGFYFAPANDDDVWTELRTALAAGAVRVVRKRGATARTACDDATAEEVPLVVTARGVSLDEGWVAGRLRDQYGADGARVVPTLGWLQALAAESHICMAASYGARAGATPAEGERGAQLGRAFAPAAGSQTIGERFAGQEVCLQHVRVDLTPAGIQVKESRTHDTECAPASETPLFVGLAGSQVQVPDGTQVCSGRDAVEAGPLPRGFYDVRVATDGGCASPGTVSLARVGILDPGTDWIPSGVRRHASGVDHEDMPAWRGVRRDDPATFARDRRNDALTFDLATPQGLAAAWNHPSSGAGTVLGRHAPNTTDQPGPNHAPGPAFRTVVTAGGQCPLSGEPTFRGPGESGPDEIVYAHLVLDPGPAEGRGPRCVARAAFKSWDPRVVANVGSSDRRQLRIGFLGHTRLGVFFSKPEPAAIGIAVPIFYTDLHLNAGFVVELSVPVTAAISWEDGRASRVSPAVMASLSWGWPEVAPRLLTLGFAIHAPWPHPDDEVWSFFAGVDITSLFSLLGGR